MSSLAQVRAARPRRVGAGLLFALKSLMDEILNTMFEIPVTATGGHRKFGYCACALRALERSERKTNEGAVRQEVSF